ncbi:uncharacterized protein [Periplaneta americana]|uniref:uncharacterized protein isoform X2 n=1 Tax=Periplaneta americana TaxID=6978 RepID=UPI0037E98DDF
MDVIKTEPKFDPLAVESCDSAHIGDGNASPAEGNLLIPHDFQTTVESMDHSFAPTYEVKIEDTPEPIVFPVVKCESEHNGHQRARYAIGEKHDS